MIGPLPLELWLEQETQRIMGPEGADYSEEPVSVYGAAARLIRDLRREREALYALLDYRKPF